MGCSPLATTTATMGAEESPMRHSSLLRTILLTIGFASFAVTSVACDDGDDAGDDGADTQADTDPTTTGGDGDGDACSDGGVYGDDAECTEYISCVETNCQTQYESCFGPDYLNGNFGGLCADYMSCNAACDCGDTACTTECYNANAAAGSPCGDCLINDIAACVAGSCLDAAQSCG